MTGIQPDVLTQLKSDSVEDMKLPLDDQVDLAVAGLYGQETPAQLFRIAKFSPEFFKEFTLEKPAEDGPLRILLFLAYTRVQLNAAAGRLPGRLDEAVNCITGRHIGMGINTAPLMFRVPNDSKKGPFSIMKANIIDKETGDRISNAQSPLHAAKAVVGQTVLAEPYYEATIEDEAIRQMVARAFMLDGSSGELR